VLILLWGLSEESTLKELYQELRNLGASTFWLNERQILETEIKLSVGSQVEGWISTPNQIIDLNSITSVYLHCYDSNYLTQVMKIDYNNLTWQHLLAVQDTLLCWAEITPALVLNRPEAIASNNSQPYQWEKILEVGFEIPDTLITTNPTAVEAFRENHTVIIYRSLHNSFNHTSYLRNQYNKNLNQILYCPSQFQQYIPGTSYRVHVVDSEIFACKVFSATNEYLYSQQNQKYFQVRPYYLPQDIADKCRILPAILNLTVAEINLRQSSDGEWYCLKVNPSPDFTYYPRTIKQSISAAIAQLLIN
jgi:hypothetical protein